MRDAARSLWAEPRVADPPPRGWRDWALLAVLVPSAVVETVVSPDQVWRPVSLLVVLAVLPTLLWRRTHPLAMVVVAFGSYLAVDVAAIVRGVEWEGFSTGAFVLLLIYALFRWASGRHAVVGLLCIMVPVLVGGVGSPNPLADMGGGTLIVLFVAALGASVRYQDNARLRAMDQVKLREREQLARELHDTVAHHVSAIAIQAQAGRTVAATHHDAAVDALGIIEKEASRTLTEMRGMVGALRQGEEAELAPPRGVADIERLARSDGDRPRVEVELSGDLDELPPAVDAALYRLAQEAITNALRHARHATRIRVGVAGDGERVRLTVHDDGHTRPAGAGASPGYGLVGMAERARLLGGTFEAGPNPDQGWTVRAVLPRSTAA